MIKLISLKINPRGITGLASPQFYFGEHITQFGGENRSGKTPMVQSLVYCLGYPVQFRQDFVAYCSSATLELLIDKKKFYFEREISSNNQSFDMTVRSIDGEVKYRSESDFSSFFFSVFGLLPINLIDLRGRSAIPYISTVFPIFYLDQDIGYAEIYKPIAKFIRDQFLEMVRYIFGFAAKNSFDTDKHVLKLKAERDALDELISAYKASQERLVNSLGTIPEAVIRAQLITLNERLVVLQESHGGHSESISAISAVRQNLMEQKWILGSEIRELSLRLQSYEKIRSEMEAEGDALSLNSKAKRLFDSVISVCNSANCGLFKTSEDSYGKNLLYIKDQIKDLNSNILSVSALRQSKSEQLSLIEKEISNLNDDQLIAERNTPIQNLVKAVNDVTRAIVDLERQLTLVDQSKKLSLKIENFEVRRGGFTTRIESLQAKGKTAEAEMHWLRSELKDATVRWLDVLETEGVDRNIKIDSLLNFEFGSEQLVSFKGSTKVRAVLAVHAALFEIYLRKSKLPMSILVFDTPNQQELEKTDLTKFMSALKQLCRKHSAQVVFASKDYKLNADGEDRVYMPEFPGDRHAMYLGSAIS